MINFHFAISIDTLVCGIVRPGEFLALMGSSGAGKTTLLNCLMFRNTGKLKIQGKRYINGSSVNTDSLARISGYVQQDDLFVPTFTVREHLEFHVPKMRFYNPNRLCHLLLCINTRGFTENGQAFNLQGAHGSRE